MSIALFQTHPRRGITERSRVRQSVDASWELHAGGAGAGVADVLGIPYDEVMQAGLIALAYTIGTDFKPAVRKPAETILHWNRW